MKKNLTSRRELLKTTAFSGAAIGLASLITSCSKKSEKAAEAPAADTAAPAPDAAEYVSEESGKAKALKYRENASDVDPALRGKKGKVEGADQFCTNCQFYTAEGNEGGKCTLFPGKKVKAQAWCVSWSFKAPS